MTTLAFAPWTLPRLPAINPRRERIGRGAAGPRLAATLITSLGALLMATVLYTGATALGAADYTVVAETLVAHDGGLVTVVDGRY